jgi:hypothetical protein
MVLEPRRPLRALPPTPPLRNAMHRLTMPMYNDETIQNSSFWLWNTLGPKTEVNWMVEKKWLFTTSFLVKILRHNSQKQTPVASCSVGWSGQTFFANCFMLVPDVRLVVLPAAWPGFEKIFDHYWNVCSLFVLGLFILSSDLSTDLSTDRSAG